MATNHRTELDSAGHQDRIATIRHAILVGLSAFGELERLQNEVVIFDRLGEPVPEGLRPIGVSGDAAAISRFAEALLNLEFFAREPQ